VKGDFTRTAGPVDRSASGFDDYFVKSQRRSQDIGAAGDF